MQYFKRIVWAIVVVAVLLVAAAGVMVSSAFVGHARLPESEDLPGGARLVRDGYVAAYILPTSERAVALVDCGNDTDAKAILEELALRQRTADDVRAIFLTHGHPDHTAGCKKFRNAQVMALQGDVGLAAGTEASRGLLTQFSKNSGDKAVKVMRVIRDGETMRVGDRSVRVYALPGHTDGSAAFFSGGVLFLGDSANTGGDGSISGAPLPFSNDVAQNHASLRALYDRLKRERQDVRTLAPSHSGPLDNGMKALGAFAASKD